MPLTPREIRDANSALQDIEHMDRNLRQIFNLLSDPNKNKLVSTTIGDRVVGTAGVPPFAVPNETIGTICLVALADYTLQKRNSLADRFADIVDIPTAPSSTEQSCEAENDA